jgi:hypothetical protein
MEKVVSASTIRCALASGIGTLTHGRDCSGGARSHRRCGGQAHVAVVHALNQAEIDGHVAAVLNRPGTLSPLIIARLTAPFRDQVWSKTVLVVAVVFVAASWGTEPISNLLLMTSRPDRGLLPPAAVRSARAFLAFALAAAACFVTEWITGTRMLIPLGFGLALWCPSPPDPCTPSPPAPQASREDPAHQRHLRDGRSHYGGTQYQARSHRHRGCPARWRCDHDLVRRPSRATHTATLRRSIAAPSATPPEVSTEQVSASFAANRSGGVALVIESVEQPRSSHRRHRQVPLVGELLKRLVLLFTESHIEHP